jgi:hypothetical protein
MTSLRMKDKWATQTEALIEGVSTAKTAAMRCASYDGVSLATPRAKRCFNQAGHLYPFADLPHIGFHQDACPG